MPQCVKDCNREFKNEAALSRHRKTCAVLEIIRQRSHEVRRGRGRSLQNISTMLSRKERLQVGDSLCSGIFISCIFDLGTSCPHWHSECDGCGLCFKSRTRRRYGSLGCATSSTLLRFKSRTRRRYGSRCTASESSTFINAKWTATPGISFTKTIS
jgi:hypothetical protein